MVETFLRKNRTARHIKRCLAILEDAIQHCRTEDLRSFATVVAAIGFLERCVDEKSPFQQFRAALENFSTNELETEAR
jgi:hypothetical protein